MTDICSSCGVVVEGEYDIRTNIFGNGFITLCPKCFGAKLTEEKSLRCKMEEADHV